MWHDSYESRLRDWKSLRDRVLELDPAAQMLAVNDWWWQAPMINRDIDWWRQESWPDPWQLLQQSGYSDLARALGIVYTLLLLDPIHPQRIRLVADRDNNLVLVDDGKYILNWCPGQILNIRSHPVSVVREVPIQQLYQKTGQQ